MAFNNFPYTNAHELNLDWVIATCKQAAADAIEAISIAEGAASHADEIEAYVNAYFDNLDVQQEINNKLNTMATDGSLANIVDDYIPPIVTSWLTAHITQETGYVIDNTLTVEGAAADAKAVGDTINALIPYNAYDAFARMAYDLTPSKGITYTRSGNVVTANGTVSSDRASYMFFYNNASALPTGLEHNTDYNAIYTTSDNNIVLQIYGYNNGGGTSLITSATGTQSFNVNFGSYVGAIVRISIQPNITVSNAQFSLAIVTAKTNMELQEELGDLSNSLTLLTNRTNNLETPFELYSPITASFVSNLQLAGTNQRFLLSNFRNNYDGNTGFTLYNSNDNGDAVSVAVDVTGVGLTGHYTGNLPGVDRTAQISFDYDLSSIESGHRYSGTGTPYLIALKTYKLSDAPVFGGFGFIENFGVIGDSYASGEIYVAADNDNGYTVADYYNLSWGQILARKCGSNCINFSKGGLTTRTWLTDANGLSLLNSSVSQTLYFCALGINDRLQLGVNYIGTVADIHDGNPSANADTFYGNYGRIVEAIKTKAPSAKIVFITFAYDYTSNERAFNTAIKAIAEHYSVPCIDVSRSSFFAQSSWYHTGKKWNHPTAPIYAAMANEYEKLFVDLLHSNYNYFTDYTGT